MPELDSTIRSNSTTLSLREGIYTNVVEGAFPAEIQPRWPPDYPEPLWHKQLGQEVKIVGVQESAGTFQYQVRILNSADTTTKIAVEAQLQELNEAERIPEEGNLPINRSPWAAVKTKMLEFLASYPVDAEKRSQIETQIKSKSKGLATAIIDESKSETGFFTGEANFAERMTMRCPGFPWDALAPLFDYSLPQR